MTSILAVWGLQTLSQSLGPTWNLAGLHGCSDKKVHSVWDNTPPTIHFYTGAWQRKATKAAGGLGQPARLDLSQVFLVSNFQKKFSTFFSPSFSFPTSFPWSSSQQKLPASTFWFRWTNCKCGGLTRLSADGAIFWNFYFCIFFSCTVNSDGYFNSVSRISFW